MARFLGKDIQSTTGRNLRHIEEATCLNPWNTGYRKIREALIMSELTEVPPEDKWRLPYLCKLLNQRREAEVLGMEQVEEVINELISSLVKN